LDPMYWAALFSFIAGASGYVIVRFWMIPILRYQRIKGRLLKALGDLSRDLPERNDQRPKDRLGKKRMQDMRRLAMQLVELNDHDLPYWYRLVLLTRKESALNASEAIMRMENLPTNEQVHECLREAALRLTTPRGLISIGLRA